MKLNIFSPLPPARTEIANNTAGTLAALQAHADVTLWTEQEAWDRSLEELVAVRPYRQEQLPWSELNRADATLYHIGNNADFHSAIWQTSRLHPGIVVLHDVRLQNLFAGLYRDVWRDRRGYLDLMERHYGEAGRRDAARFWEGGYSTEYISEHYPLTFAALENALGVVVHTAEAFDIVSRARRWPVVRAPLPYRATRRSASQQARRARLRQDAPPFRLVVFGYLGANRRLDAIVRALAEFPRREQFRLDIYGQCWNAARVRSLIDSFDMQTQATLHGFVPDSELNDALARAHLAINLRYPTMGEASGSQLRIWDNALPSLVTPVGVYAESPKETVAYVRPEREVADIQRHLRAFLANPARFARMGENGRRSLEEFHAPETYARLLSGFVSRVGGFRRRATAHALAERVGSEIGAWVEPDLTPRVSAEIACRIHSMLLSGDDAT